MRIEQKNSVKNNIGRLVFVGISLIIQITWFVLLFARLGNYSGEIAMVSSVLALGVVLKIYGRHMNAAFKMPWIILILAFPPLGLTLYFLMGQSLVTRRIQRHYNHTFKEWEGKLVQDKRIMENLEKENLYIANQSRYIYRSGNFPVYQNTDVVYYSEAVFALQDQIEELKKAKSFIFMEYHAIEDTRAFGNIKKILVQKVKQGVEVRIIYDEVGSVGFIDKGFIKRMEAEGIRCRVFNPLVPFVNVFMNNRDHRKITVIDGRVGFTGGYNLADEYFNYTSPYGHWKDSGIKLSGDAVRSQTVLFLEMWNAIGKTDEDSKKYFPACNFVSREEGFVQPYGDTPLDEEYLGENVYLNMIKNAKRTIYFMTPYLIIDDEMIRELGLAAKRGIDVRIITPGIPDKKIIYKVTRSYYAGLAREGVRIFEYTPGFLHAKECICDGEAATVGTINMDYRSLYLHFENGVYLYKVRAVHEIKKDFDETLSKSREVTATYKEGRTAVLRGSQYVLRLFSPLL